MHALLHVSTDLHTKFKVSSFTNSKNMFMAQKSTRSSAEILSSAAKLYKLKCGPMPNVMAAMPNKGGTLCSAPQSLPDAAAAVPCSNAPNIGECKTWTQSELCSWQISLRGQEPPRCIYSVSTKKWPP